MANWRDTLHIWPRELPAVQLDINKTALIIVDMQLFDTSREHGLAFSMKKFPEMYEYYYSCIDRVVLPNSMRLLEFFRKNDLPVIHLTIGAELKQGGDLIPRRKRRDKIMTEKTGVNFTFYKGSEAHQIHPLLKPVESELVINKNSASPFNSTGIDQLLRNMDITGLIIIGVSTCSCVETTARDASDRGYECVLVEDACATFDQESHDSSLKIFARMFGEVMTTEQVMKHLNGLLDQKER